MNITQAIKRFEEIRAQEGDLDLFDANFYEIVTINTSEKEENQFPDDWNMPDKFIQIGSRD